VQGHVYGGANDQELAVEAFLGLYDQIWRQMAFGHAVKARMSCRRCPGVRRPGQFVAGRVEQPAEQGVDGVGVGLVRVPSLARPRQALVWAHRIGGSSP
jgi:hypothetical protein